MSPGIGRAVGALLAAALSGWAATAGEASRPGGTPLRVLIISGRGDHDWRATTPCLRRALADTGRFDVRVCESPAGLTARTLADFDVLVDDCGRPGPGGDAEKVIAAFVGSGKGLVITHGALASFAGMHLPASGEHPPGPGGEAAGYCPAVPASGRPGPANFIEVKIARPEHAIARGLRGRFRTTDAPYRGMAVARGAEVIAVAVGDDARGAKEEPVLVASGYGKGRVFCSALGSDVAAMQDREFVAAFARGTEWAATGAATLPASAGPPRSGDGEVRGLVVTGGHDHFTSFYTLFEGRKELAGMPVASAATAFQGDLRGKYDVLVLYDFTRDLDDAGKRHLREFVESGKGVVVLHHALLDYQEWPWWYEDVVGGSYRLKKQGDVPSSTYKGGQKIFVTPEGEHPVTAGVGRFHVLDETYKRMRFSPRVRPLLTTDHPDSDRYLAWVGPCATSRVVAIQLGHGPTVFEHPSYRKLVHNAVLWAARRPE